MTPIASTDLVGAGISPTDVVAQAYSLRVLAQSTSAGGTAITTTWATLPDSYRSTGADRLYTVMDPVGSDTADISAWLEKAAGAFEQYADDVKAVLDERAALAAKVDAFSSSTTTDYPKVSAIQDAAGYGIAGGQGPTTAGTTYATWEDDPDAQQTQHDLSAEAAKLAAHLLEVQQKCATALRASAGLGSVGDAQITQLEAQLRAGDGDRYWDAGWAASLHQAGEQGSCATAEVGFIHSIWKAGVDFSSITGLAGIDLHAGKWFDGDVFSSSWAGLNDVVMAIDPVNFVPAFIDGMWGGPGAIRDEDRETVDHALSFWMGLVSLEPPDQWWSGDSWASGWSDGTITAKYREDFVQALVEAAVNLIPVAGLVLKGLRGVTIASDAERATLATLDVTDAAKLKDLSHAQLRDVIPDIDRAGVTSLRDLLDTGPLAKDDLTAAGLHDLGVELDRLDEHAATNAAAANPAPQFVPADHPYGSGVSTKGPGNPAVSFGTTSPNELGVIGERLTRQDLVDRGYRIVAEQAQIAVPGQPGVWFKPDFIVVDPATGDLVMVESKMNGGAAFTDNQRFGYDAFENGSYEPLGRSVGTETSLLRDLQAAGVPVSPRPTIARVEVYRWNVDIVPDAALRARAGVP